MDSPRIASQTQILDPTKKKVGNTPTRAVTKMRTIAKMKCIVMNERRVDIAKITNARIQMAVKRIALFPGVPPIQGKSFRKSSFPAPLWICCSICSLGGRGRSQAPHLGQLVPL